MTLKFRILAGSALAGLLVTGNASAETLGDAVSSAILSNPQLESQRVESDIARESLEQARAGGRTTVTVGGSAGYQYTDTNSPFSLSNGNSGAFSSQVQATKPIYTGGRVSAGIRQAKAGISAADAQYDAAEQDLILQVITAYMDVRRDRETISIRQNNVEVSTEQLRAAEDRFEVGVVTRTDVSLARANFEGTRASLAGAEAALETSLANYSFLTGLTPGDLAPPPPVPTLPQSLEEATQLGLDANPDMIAARHSERAAMEAIEAAKAQGRPSVNLVGTAQGQYSEFENGNSRQTSVSGVVQGSIPIMTGGLVKSQTKAARLRRDQARRQIDALDRSIRAQVASAWYGYDATLRTIEASKRQVDAAEIAYDGAKEELAVGVRTTLDVLNQEQQLFEARLALVQAERDAYVAAHQLLRATGQLAQP
ncbi:TolC family outer membrane protein [uncultured Hyphomonas sp.]|uniref:TolC family outer membrane protein n=1 Tax=uncultured Hyphomonas sp. TaxID=225298 RepID=UPI002AAB961F|nr:TolC family outer membrane protein [uncultured Hyphomonas sp.]